ncbi:hypothetical protein [Chitinimonas sp.]|uniref:hypothetical protein n=1 Tax=Chitinimonas sp. TaxID=1934313 RepID=UPI002F927166
MSPLKKGVLVALLQVLLVGSVGAKFVYDRVAYPKAWLKTQPFDPNLPIRGRYVRLAIIVELDNKASPQGDYASRPVRLAVRDGNLVAIPDRAGPRSVHSARCGQQACWVLSEPVAYFIPEHAQDPSIRKPGEELWVEATIPPNGPPRPIQLGVKVEGKLVSLEIN